MTAPTAVIADDEPLLVAALQHNLEDAWPELQVVATAQNGPEAIDCISTHKPDIAFLDIQMPGATGIDVAHAVMEDWPSLQTSPPLPLCVFVTAFDDYAIAAFEAAAFDYVLKPVKPARLATTVARLRGQLENRVSSQEDDLSAQLRQLINSELQRQPSPQSAGPLRTINTSTGTHVKVIPVQDIILFVSSDKYVTVITESGESLIREPLKKLLPQLDPAQFAQIHRSTLVNLSRVKSAHRDDKGRMTLTLDGTAVQPAVSRVYQSLFQAM